MKFVAGVAGTAAGTAATVKTTQTAAKTIRDKNATTQEKAAAVFDASLSAAGAIGSAALAVKSFPAVKHEIGYYMAKYQCKTQSAIPTDEGATTATAKSAGGRLGNSATRQQNKAIPKNTKGIKHIATPIFPVTNVTSTIIKKRTVVTIPKFFTNLLNLMTLSINSISLYDSHFSFFTF